MEKQARPNLTGEDEFSTVFGLNIFISFGLQPAFYRKNEVISIKYHRARLIKAALGAAAFQVTIVFQIAAAGQVA